MAFTMTPDIPSSRSMAQRKVCRNHWNGSAISRATRSARARLTVFGTNSPSTTCIALSKAKAQAKATACAKNTVRVPCVPCQICCNASASVASPSAPMARLDSVMPTWTPDTTRCRSASNRSTTRARMSPLATSWRMRDSRTATRENSAAAKNPFRATSASTPISRTANIASQLSSSGIVAVLSRSAGRRCLLYTRVMVTKMSSPLSASFTPPFWAGRNSSRSARSSLRRNPSWALMASAMRGEAE